MKHTRTDYPEGARWELVEGGKHGYIELSERKRDFEVWIYGWRWSDGSGGMFDWTTSYSSARNDLPLKGRFKRVNP